MPRVSNFVLAAALLAPLHGSTLQQLSLDDMIRKSTLIVRGKVQPQNLAVFHGSLIWTHYQVQVTEVYKGTTGSQLDIAIPGGVSNGIQQTYSGVPSLASGQDYVMFLWTSKSGLTQVIGLSQGLFAVTSNSGLLQVVRAAATERMLNAAGQAVTDTDIQMPLGDLRNRIQTLLSAKGGQ